MDRADENRPLNNHPDGGGGETGAVRIIWPGAQTALGRTALSAATAVLAGINAQEDHPTVLDREGEPARVTMAPYLDEELSLIDRVIELAAGAIEEAMTPLRLLEGGEAPPQVPLILGLPAPGRGLPIHLESEVARRLRASPGQRPAISSVKTVRTGHSAGLMAVQEAWDLIREGHLSCCLAGGVDSYITPSVLRWLDARNRIMGDRNPWGLCPGEGAGVCLLASGSFLPELPTVGRIIAMATTREEHLIHTGSVCTAGGLTEAWRLVLAGLPEGGKVAAAIGDLNGETYRADELGFTLVRLKDRFEEPASIMAPADRWGDVGAASGPLFIALAAGATLAAASGGGRFLIWTSAETGERTAALIEVAGRDDVWETTT